MSSVQSAALLAALLAAQPQLGAAASDLSVDLVQITSQSETLAEVETPPSGGELDPKLRAAACRLETLATVAAIGASQAFRDRALRAGLTARCAACAKCPDMAASII